MNKQDIYTLLEQKMLSYADYASVPVQVGDEPFVAITNSPGLTAIQPIKEMEAYTGAQVFVREQVYQQLQQAGRSLQDYNPELQLQVNYGYRALTIQKQLFEREKARLQGHYNGEELLAAVHRLVAVPDVAGHPAGAAVDIQIISNNKALDFGTNIWEFVPDTFTFSPFISVAAWENRQLLRRVMLQAGFAPFDGEWWHFSYGDKEWAKYYDKPGALYQQRDFKSVSRST